MASSSQPFPAVVHFPGQLFFTGMNLMQDVGYVHDFQAINPDPAELCKALWLQSFVAGDGLTTSQAEPLMLRGGAPDGHEAELDAEGVGPSEDTPMRSIEVDSTIEVWFGELPSCLPLCGALCAVTSRSPAGTQGL